MLGRSETHHHLDAIAKHVWEQATNEQKHDHTHAHEQNSMRMCVCVLKRHGKDRNNSTKLNTYEKATKLQKKKTTTNPTNSKRLYYVWQTIDQKVSGACTEKRMRVRESKWYFSTFHHHHQQQHKEYEEKEDRIVGHFRRRILISNWFPLIFIDSEGASGWCHDERFWLGFQGLSEFRSTTLDHWS